MKNKAKQKCRPSCLMFRTRAFTLDEIKLTRSVEISLKVNQCLCCRRAHVRNNNIRSRQKKRKKNPATIVRKTLSPAPVLSLDAQNRFYTILRAHYNCTCISPHSRFRANKRQKRKRRRKQKNLPLIHVFGIII